MKIDKVEVKNFRLLKDFTLDLRDDLSLLVGKNNTGKTSVMTVLEQILGSSTSPKFTWNDFNIEFQKEFYKYIKKINFEEQEKKYIPQGIKVNLIISYDETDSYKNLQNFMMDLDPENNLIIINFLYVCLEDKLKTIKEDLTINGIKEFKDFSKFMVKNIKEYFHFSIHSQKWDYIKKEKIEEYSDEIHLSEVKKLIKFRGIKANRDTSNKENDHSLSRLSHKYYKLIDIENKNVIKNLEDAITKADEDFGGIYSDMFKDIIKNVRDFGGQSDGPVISIESSINEVDLLKNNTLLLYDFKGHNLPENYNGLGYLNLISMIFEIETILLEFQGDEMKEKSDINILFIEEPEAHTHPQLQYIFIKNIKSLINEHESNSNDELNIQTIITTHSSHILSSTDDFNDIRYLKFEDSMILAKNMADLEKLYEDVEVATKDSEESTLEVFKFIKQYLTLNSSELFFTEKAIIIEGDTERILLPTIIKKYDEANKNKNALPLLSQNITILTIGAHAYLFERLFEFLGIKVLIITDIDGVKKETITKKNGKKQVSRKASCSSKAEYTSNHTLINLLKLNNDKEHFTTLTSLSDEEKEIKNIRVAYQIEKDGYTPRSFEDAFLQENYTFIYENKNNFIEGLKNRGKIESSPAYGPNGYLELANKVIAKKSAFAIEILLNEGENDEIWTVPNYIEEGLKWLQDS